MPRAKTRVMSHARRKKITDATKGFFGKRKNCNSTAHDALWRAGVYAYRDRRSKKRDFRSLWIMRINAAARINGCSYGKLIGAMKKKGIEINRKNLAYLAVNQPDLFSKIVAEAKA